MTTEEMQRDAWLWTRSFERWWLDMWVSGKRGVPGGEAPQLATGVTPSFLSAQTNPKP
jgi:hypothetical protein